MDAAHESLIVGNNVPNSLIPWNVLWCDLKTHCIFNCIINILHAVLMSSYKLRDLWNICITFLSHCKTFKNELVKAKKKKSSHVHLSNTQRQLNVSRPSWRPAVWEEKSGWPGREEPPAGRVCPSPPPAGGPAAGAELLSADRTDHSRPEPDSLQHWTWMIQKTHMNHHCEEEKHQIFSCDSEPVNQNTQHAKYTPFFPLELAQK